MTGTADGIPGAIRYASGQIPVNQGRETAEITIVNTGDRPVQVGSHFHLPDTNAVLHFDRDAARGTHLDIPAGTAVRFEPGVSRTVSIVHLAGRGRVPGLQIHRDTGDVETGYPSHGTGWH